jgi:hypothetical protein
MRFTVTEKVTTKVGKITTVTTQATSRVILIAIS